LEKPNEDDWTIERWKTEPRLMGLEFSEAMEQAPPLWKDLTLASAVAVLLWAIVPLILRNISPALGAQPFLIGSRPVHRHPLFLEHFGHNDVAAVDDVNLDRHAGRHHHTSHVRCPAPEPPDNACTGLYGVVRHQACCSTKKRETTAVYAAMMSVIKLCLTRS